MQTLSAEQRRFSRPLESRLGARAAADTNVRVPRGPFQQSADGTSLRDVVRFWSKVRYGPDCWEWQATPSQAYGLFRHKGKMRKAHRVAYELTHGLLAQGAILLHQCDNPRCVRPAHLQPGTYRDNLMDAIEKGRWSNSNTQKQVCKRGHEPNWYVDKNGGRHCRPCAAMHQRARKARRRAES